MNCPDSEQIEHYVCGRLSETKLAEFEAHLQDCPKCSCKVAEARENESLLSELREFQTKDSLVSAKKVTRLQEIGTIG